MALPQSIRDSLKRLQNIASGSTGEDDSPETLADVATVVKNMSFKDYTVLSKVGMTGATNKNIDDKTYLMESIIDVVADIPPKSVLSNTLTHKFLDQLWTDLEHPPQSYLGKDYVYRKADGSNNNFLWPHIGQAGQPYARSVKPVKMQPVARPDPSVIFDSILERKKWEPHPNKISSVLFYIASIIIHDCFHTSHTDFNKSNTSSYLDLAPLYGSSTDQQQGTIGEDGQRGDDGIRTMKDGKLKTDCFSDQRILGFPPGVGLLLIFFNRFHNEVVDKLAQIDENGRFSRIRHPKPCPRNYDGEKEYDEALFQTARLVTTGLYINIVLQDYVRSILNLNRVDTKWNLDPRSEQGKALFGEKIPVATGNQVSAEFNLVYRWHSCVSQRDEKWTEASVEKIFPMKDRKDPSKEPTMEEFLGALRDWAYQMPKDPFERSFEDLQRDPKTGRFNDDDLAKIWTESVEDVAGAYGARHVPKVLKMVEILGINQSRTWNLASLNEFRKYFKLQPHETFESINPDPYVQDQLKRLYGHPDNVEIYPGIVVEAAKKPLAPGSGLCTTFTTSRAILSDAVALVRGDRFYTVDYTPQNLTNYGMTAASYDVDVNYGGVMYKLVLNALPNNYSKNSIYAHYPLTVPSENQKILKDLKHDHLYDFSAPKKQAIPPRVKSFEACKALFINAAKTTSLTTIAPSTVVVDKKLSLAGSSTDAQTLSTLRKYLSTNPSKKYIIQFFENVTSDLLQKHSYEMAKFNEVDIIQDVANLAQVHFAACVFALPLKTDSNPDGAFEADKLWSILTALYSSLHTVSSPAESFRTQLAAHGAVEGLGKYIVENIKEAHPEKNGLLEWAANLLHQQHSGDLTDQSTHLIQELIKTGVKPQNLAYNYLLPIAATLVVSQARAFADCLTYILGGSGDDTVCKSLQKLAAARTPQADLEIEHIVLEALRMNSKTNIYVTATSPIKVNEGGKTLEIVAGQTVLCDISAAYRDDAGFKEATRYDSTRGIDTYLPGLPSLPPTFPGQELGRPALVGMLKAIMRLQGLRRAKGPLGQMRVIKSRNGSKVYLTRDESKAYLYPSSMKVNFD